MRNAQAPPNCIPLHRDFHVTDVVLRDLRDRVGSRHPVNCRPLPYVNTKTNVGTPHVSLMLAPGPPKSVSI